MFKPLKALFGSSEPEIKIVDKVWMSTAAKLKACAAMAAASHECVFVCWFRETHHALAEVVQTSQLLMADQVLTTENKMVVFAEHYPMRAREMQLFKTLNLKEIPVLSALDEPFFMRFGGQRTIDLMKKLGMNEADVVGHTMISKSIKNAQQKIAEHVTVEREADSQQEWFTLNLPA